MLAYLFTNLFILSITLITIIFIQNSNSNINTIQKKQHIPINLKPILGNGFLICFIDSIGISVFIIFNKLMRLNPVFVALIFGIIVCLCALCGVSPYIRSLRLISSVRCCQLGGGGVCCTGSDKYVISIGFIAMIGIHFLIQDLFLTFFNSISRLLMLNPVCGFSKWYQYSFFSARICICYRFRSLRRLLLFIDTEFDFDFCFICFNIIFDFYFLYIIWHIFCFFDNNIQCKVNEPITWYWFQTWNFIKGDR